MYRHNLPHLINVSYSWPQNKPGSKTHHTPVWISSLILTEVTGIGPSLKKVKVKLFLSCLLWANFFIKISVLKDVIENIFDSGISSSVGERVQTNYLFNVL